jgi:hypothetical protein
MQHPENFDCIALNPINKDIGGMGNNKFPRPFDPACSPHLWELGELFHCCLNFDHQIQGRVWITLGNIIMGLLQISQSIA